jgi:hypothetical protein
VAAVRVGAYEKALAAMQEFLAQSEVGEQLVKAGPAYLTQVGDQPEPKG